MDTTSTHQEVWTAEAMFELALAAYRVAAAQEDDEAIRQLLQARIEGKVWEKQDAVSRQHFADFAFLFRTAFGEEPATPAALLAISGKTMGEVAHGYTAKQVYLQALADGINRLAGHLVEV